MLVTEGWGLRTGEGKGKLEGSDRGEGGAWVGMGARALGWKNQKNGENPDRGMRLGF